MIVQNKTNKQANAKQRKKQNKKKKTKQNKTKQNKSKQNKTSNKKDTGLYPEGVGLLTLKTVTGICDRKDPLFTPLIPAPQDHLFGIYQFHKTPILTKNHKIAQFSVYNA